MGGHRTEPSESASFQVRKGLLQRFVLCGVQYQPTWCLQHPSLHAARMSLDVKYSHGEWVKMVPVENYASSKLYLSVSLMGNRHFFSRCIGNISDV